MESVEQTCPNVDPYQNIATGGDVQGPFMLQIDAAANQYTLQFPGVLATLSGSGVEISAPWGPTVTNPLPATGLMLSGQFTIPLDQFGSVIFESLPITADDFHQIFGLSMLQITWNLQPTPNDLEVVVDPGSGYKNWLPKGNLEDPNKHGNTLSMHAILRKKDGTPSPTKADSFLFELENVSTEPGVCMNFPADSASTAPDLQFESDLNTPPANSSLVMIVGTNEMEVLDPVNQGLKEATAIVSSFDFGAYGQIKVTARFNAAPDIVGYLKDDPAKTQDIPMPKSRSGSHIADTWKEHYGVTDSDDEDDLDETPQGDGHNGDGLSLYEEYRGFSVDRVHVRTSPGVKDLFIRDEIGNASIKFEIMHAQHVSGLKIHHKLREDEIGPDGVINYRNSWAHQTFDQHGLVIKGRQKKLGYSIANSRAGAIGNSTPGSKKNIEMEPRAGTGLDLTSDKAEEVDYTSFAEEDAAHEIMHGCSVWHHGECDVGDIRWILDTNGNPREIRKNIGTWDPIAIFKPDGTPATPGSYTNSDLGVLVLTANYLAVPHGQHSGDTSCVMCYDVADCFMRDHSANRFYMGTWPWEFQDRLCNSAAGTGINATGPNGQPWFGDAYEGGGNTDRGSCKYQVCVNDHYVADETHNRRYTCEPW